MFNDRNFSGETAHRKPRRRLKSDVKNVHWSTIVCLFLTISWGNMYAKLSLYIAQVY